jgi:hypothetical protein
MRPWPAEVVAAQSARLASHGVGHVDQYGALADHLLQHGRKKAVMGAAEHDAIDAAFQQGFEARPCVVRQRRIVELEHFDMGCPAGTGFDMDLDSGGMVADQLVQTGILPIFACHSFGPVWCTEVPLESTATVTGMSFTSNS